ncbi:MAG TPA: phage holin family protein [Polyangia bacterium]
MKKSPTSQSDGIIGLVREAIDGLGDLVGQHLHLARLELVSDLRGVGRRAQRSAILGGLGVIGYTLALAGLAVFLGGHRPTGAWLLLFGGVHLTVAAIGFLVGRAGSNKKLMDTNLEQVGESIATLQRAVTGDAHDAPKAALPAAPSPTIPVAKNGQSAQSAIARGPGGQGR